MALTTNQWHRFQRLLDQHVADHGEWVGLFDGNFQPICQLPPLVAMQASGASHGIEEATFEFPALTSHGQPHAATDALFGEGFMATQITELAAPVDRKFFIVIQRPGGRAGRRVFLVVMPELVAIDSQPSTVTVEAIDANHYLAATPAPSVPVTWGHVPVQEWSQDAGGTYPGGKTYTYAPIEMATVSNGYTLIGPARQLITRLTAESLAATYKAAGWDPARPHLVVTDPGGGPELLMTRRDVSVWETIEEPAALAGVVVRTGLWLPGDEPVVVRFGDSRFRWDDSRGPVLVTDVV